MHLTLAAAAFWALTVVAQDLSNIPNCGLKCITEAIPLTGCATPTDFSCVCKAADKITSTIQTCAGQACSVQDFESIPAALEKFCAAAGVQISVDSALPATATSPATSPSSPAPAPASTSVAASSTGASSTSSRSGSPTTAAAGSSSTPSSTAGTNAGVQLGFTWAQVSLVLTSALIVSSIVL